MKVQLPTPILHYSPMSSTIGPLQIFACHLAVAHIFVSYGRISEFVPSAHLTLLVGIPALLFTFLCGGLRRVFSSRVGMLMVLFSAWAVATVPFSVWPGGSVATLKNKWFLAFAGFIIIVAPVITLEQCRRAMYALGGAATVIAFLTSIYGRGSKLEADRIRLWGGSLGNSNDLAAVLLMGAPFCLLMAMEPGSKWRKFSGFAALLFIVPVVFQTGSRSGLLALLVLFLAYFRQASAAGKFKLAAAFGILVMVGMASTAETALRRFTVLRYNPNAEYSSKAEISAARSAEGRWQMLKQSVTLTLQNPIFGVGIGEFQVGSSRYSGEQGQKAAWKETHNTWTQISSETGFPGLFFYGGAVVVCLRTANSIRKTARRRRLTSLYNMSLCLYLSLLGMVVLGMFSSLAYGPFIPIVLGVAASFLMAARAELKSGEALTAPGATRAAA